MVVADQLDTMYANNRRVLKFTVTDEDNTGALDLTGMVVKFALARFDSEGQPIKANPVIDKRSDTSAEVTITDAANGLVEVELIPSDTASLADQGETNYYFELEVFEGTDPVVVATGTLTIRRNVTNA